MWAIVTASGARVKGKHKNLAEALEAYPKLPEADRKPKVEDRGPHNPKLQYADVAPAGTLFVNVYCRVLEPARGPVPPREEGGPDGVRRQEPRQQHARRLLRAAARVPLAGRAGVEGADAREAGRRRQGRHPRGRPAAGVALLRLQLVRELRRRLLGAEAPARCVAGTDRAGGVGQGRAPAAERPGLVQGRGRGRQVAGRPDLRPVAARDRPEELPATYRIDWDVQIEGVLEYDPGKKRFTRFDAVGWATTRGRGGWRTRRSRSRWASRSSWTAGSWPRGTGTPPMCCRRCGRHYWAPEKWKPRD